MNLIKDIRNIRIYAILLFLIPTLALIGSVFFHNFLVSFKYQPSKNFVFEKNFQENFQENVIGATSVNFCDENNNFCHQLNFELFDNLDQCYKNDVINYYVDENGTRLDDSFNNPKKRIDQIKNNNFSISRIWEASNEINTKCIRNSFHYKFYKIIPFFYEQTKFILDKKLPLGTQTRISPFLNGETSISNIVKRFPINFFFKPMIYIGVIIMISYWFYYNRVLQTLNSTRKNYMFFKFGILSAIFLFLHTFFLGWTFENEILTKLRRTYVIFFIFFEVAAQALLIKKIFNIKNKIKKYLNIFIVYLKMIFVLTICSITFLILMILIKYNLDSKIDYILEWNYFLVLLFFYFLSFLMWKKNINL